MKDTHKLQPLWSEQCAVRTHRDKHAKGKISEWTQMHSVREVMRIPHTWVTKMHLHHGCFQTAGLPNERGHGKHLSPVSSTRPMLPTLQTQGQFRAPPVQRCQHSLETRAECLGLLPVSQWLRSSQALAECGHQRTGQRIRCGPRSEQTPGKR